MDEELDRLFAATAAAAKALHEHRMSRGYGEFLGGSGPVGKGPPPDWPEGEPAWQEKHEELASAAKKARTDYEDYWRARRGPPKPGRPGRTGR